MGRYKRIVILLAVLVVVSAAAFGISRYEEKKEQIKNSDEVILAIDHEAVSELSWETKDISLSFRKDEKWIYQEDEAFPVDEEKMKELLSVFQEFGASFVIEEVEDYGQYGLDDPECTIRFTADGTSYEVLLGAFSTMDEERYVAVKTASESDEAVSGAGDGAESSEAASDAADEEGTGKSETGETSSDATDKAGADKAQAGELGKVYLVKNDPMDSFDVTLSDLIDNDETPILTDTTEIQFSGTESGRILYEEESSHTWYADDVYFLEQEGEYLPLDTSRVDSYLNQISGLDLTDYASYNATEEELRSFGLDDPELTINVTYLAENEDGEEASDTFILHISRDAEERAAAQKEADELENKGAATDTQEADEAGNGENKAADSTDTEVDSEEDEITAYARVGESQIVYRLDQADYELLMGASYNDLRHLEVLPVDFADVTQVDISLEDKVYTLTCEEEEEESIWYYLGEEVEMADFKSAVRGLKADSFTDEQPSGKEEIGLTVYLNKENYPQMKIDLYRYDGEFCLAMVGDEPVSLVSRSAVVDLIESIQRIVLGKE